jgi:putative ABC transport system ATP-binding protein
MRVGVDVRLEDVSKRYRSDGALSVDALQHVTVLIGEGQIVAITGPSGSGKSTFLHVVGAMDTADQGLIRVGGREITALSSHERALYRRSVGFVFQRFLLIPSLTVLDNVIVPVVPFRTTFDKEARAQELLGAVGLEERTSSLPSKLSGGQQQRVAIARALINSPGLLLADEPTGNIDSEASLEIMDLLLDLRRARGMTVVVATHDPLVASRCDRVIRLVDGRLVEDLEIGSTVTPEDVFERISRPGP